MEGLGPAKDVLCRSHEQDQETGGGILRYEIARSRKEEIAPRAQRGAAKTG